MGSVRFYNRKERYQKYFITGFGRAEISSDAGVRCLKRRRPTPSESREVEKLIDDSSREVGLNQPGEVAPVVSTSSQVLRPVEVEAGVDNFSCTAWEGLGRLHLQGEREGLLGVVYGSSQHLRRQTFDDFMKSQEVTQAEEFPARFKSRSVIRPAS